VGSILVGVVTTIWGITVETRYAGYWTIFFNVIASIVIIATVDVPSEFLVVMGIYLIVSIFAMSRNGTKSQPLKQVVGAKSFGALTIVLGIFQYFHLPLNWIRLTILWIGLSVVVYWLWNKYKNR
jgi:hypothetical protein